MPAEPHVVLGEVLGTGGMGRVFAGEDLNREAVAVKVLHDALVSDPVMVKRFLDEGRAAQRVSHDNVVRMLDFGVDNGRPYLIMRRAEGVPLGLLVQLEGPLSFARIRNIADQIFSGVSAIHRAGLVHGDLKSDNILVDPKQGDTVTIIDFGLAREPGTTYPSTDQMITGTPEYMAPELVRGERISYASEIYAVGVILYEMLTGSTPFGGGSATAVFERHLADDVVPPSLRCPDRTIPVSLEAAIVRALDKDPLARHLNADLFATAVDRSIDLDCNDRDDGAARPIAKRRSPASPTSEWVSSPRRRLAAGTAREHTGVEGRRRELREACARREAEPVVVACLSLVEALTAEDRIVTATSEIEATIEWLARENLVAAGMWRLQLMLATIYDVSGKRERARTAAVDALLTAERSDDPVAPARVRAFLRRRCR